MGSFFTNRFFGLGFWAIDIILLLAIAGVVIVLATDDRDPSTVLAWLFVVLLLPVLGLIAYFFIGRNFRRDSPRRRKIMAQMDAVAAESLAPVQDANTEFTDDAVNDLVATPGARIEAVGRTEGGVAPLPADTVDIYTAGAQKFPALLEEMATAERYIHLMYLIWEQDELTAKVKTVLLDRLKAGVKVHILYDWLSLHQLQEGRAERARRRRRRRGPLLQAPAPPQLPQPHEDGDHRRQVACTAAA